VGASVAVGAGVGVAAGTGVAVGTGTGVGVLVGTGVGGVVVLLTPEAQADRTNNKTATKRRDLVGFI